MRRSGGHEAEDIHCLGISFVSALVPLHWFRCLRGLVKCHSTNNRLALKRLQLSKRGLAMEWFKFARTDYECPRENPGHSVSSG